MKTTLFITVSLIIASMITSTANVQAKSSPPLLKEENVTYMDGEVTLKGFVVYDQNNKGKRPAILVVPEWWGLNDYTKMRARKLAALGYIAMAVDMFGDGKIAANPKEAQELTGPFYKDSQLGKGRLDAAIVKIKQYEQTDPDNVAAIGYCFGGGVVLNSAKLGADLKAVVSFHGGLPGILPEKNMLKAKVLVCHGGSDKFVSMADAEKFKHQMDSVGAAYTFKVYPNATHAFTNPDATRIGKEFKMPIQYNPEADKNSWADMRTFLKGALGK
jgi:dienelactone hydrolase